MTDDQNLSSILLQGIEAIPVEHGIYGLASSKARQNEYDRMSGMYDRVMGNWLYNRLMWGYSVSSLGEICRAALSSSSDGWVLDAGCGSLIFTAEVYAQNTDRPVVLVDLSLEMLRRARARMTRICGEIPPNMIFLHADALNPPFRSDVFCTAICLNLLHVLDDAQGFLRGLERMVSPDGDVASTTLVLNNRIGDSYMRFLSRNGLIRPRTVREVTAFFDALGSSFSHYLRGNMLFIHNLGQGGSPQETSSTPAAGAPAERL